MNETRILEKWIDDGEKIAFWGASDLAQGLMRDLLTKFSALKPVCVFDSMAEDSSIDVNGACLPVRKPGKGGEALTGCKIVLCIQRRQYVNEISEVLEKAGLNKWRDWIDGYECGDSTGTVYFPYDRIRPFVRYAPWRKDENFSDIYNEIRNHTMVDIYRCYELWQSLLQTRKCTGGDILEVGVYKGGTGALLASAAKQAQIKSNVYLCDTFEGVVKTTEKDRYYTGGEHSDTSVNAVEKLLYGLGLENVQVVKGIFPDDVKDRFHDKKWRFVHIDVDAYQSAKDVFLFIWEQMENGGMVIFDDYGFITTSGVSMLLDELKTLIEDGIFVANLNGHGVFIKTACRL